MSDVFNLKSDMGGVFFFFFCNSPLFGAFAVGFRKLLAYIYLVSYMLIKSTVSVILIFLSAWMREISAQMRLEGFFYKLFFQYFMYSLFFMKL
jgi:hypothetical protein